MKDFLKYISSPAFYVSVIIIVVTVVVLSLIKKYLIKKVAYTNKNEQHKNTLYGVVFNLLQYLVIILAVVIVLKLNGVNITSILAGLGIVATIIGLALQDTIKDIITGVSIYNNNFYKVGDVVRYEGHVCEVKYFSTRVTKFRDLLNDSTITVSNRCVSAIEKIKKIDILPYYFDREEDPIKIKTVFDSIRQEIEDIYGVNNVVISNVGTDIKGYSIVIIANANPRLFYTAKFKIQDIANQAIIKNKLKFRVIKEIYEK